MRTIWVLRLNEEPRAGLSSLAGRRLPTPGLITLCFICFVMWRLKAVVFSSLFGFLSQLSRCVSLRAKKSGL